MRTITINVPSKLAVSENGIAPNQPQQSSSSAIDKLLIANTTLAVWLVFFAVGGGILALYYARIGYLPEMEWKAALVYLFVGSMVGGTVGLLLTISVFMPGVIWSEFIIFDPDLDGYLSYDLKDREPSGKESLRKEPCMRSIITYLGLPFIVVLLLSHLTLWARVPVNWSNEIKYLDLYWVIVVLLLLVTFCVMRSLLACVTLDTGWSGFWSILKGNPLDVIRNRKPIVTEPKQRQIFKYATWFTLAVFLNQLSMYVIYRLSGTPRRMFKFLILTILCTAFVAIATHAVAALYRQHKLKAVVASLVAAGLLLFTADNFSSLSMRLMNRFGFGYSQKFNLRVNDDGARTVHELGLKCEESYHYLCDVEILSKVGDHYYLSVGGKVHTTLPKSDVVSIQRLEPLKFVESTED